LLLPDCEHSVDASGQLLEALVDLADNWLNLKRLDAEIPSEATRIETSLKRTGFDYEGATLKSIFFESEYHDETVLARLRGFDTGDHKTRPAVTYPRKSGAHVESSGVQIRQMTSDDIDDLYEIFRAPENCRTTLQLPSQELWLTRQRVLEPPANMTRLVAVCDGRAVGMVSMMRHKPACRAHVAAIGMMVHPEFWRQRIGSRLMEELLEIADNQLNLTRIELQVHADNPAGIRLYEKCGFVVEGTKQFHTYGDGGWANTHIMARLSI
jgi:putative acetyltransferase